MKSWVRWLRVAPLAVLLAGSILVFTWGGETSAFYHADDSNPLTDLESQGYEVVRSATGPLALQTDSSKSAYDTLLVVPESSREYGPEDRKALDDFLKDGGHAIVFDGFGHGGTLTKDYGIGIHRVRMADPDSDNHATIATNGKDWNVALQNPSALRLQDFQGEVLAVSSERSFLDLDGDGVIIDSEPRGPFPLVVRQTFGDNGGALVVVADSGLFHSTLDIAENNQWRDALIRSALPAGGRIMIDESRLPSGWDVFAATLGTSLVFMQSSPWNYFLIGVTAATCIGLGLRYLEPIWRTHRFRPGRFIYRAEVNRADGSAAQSGTQTGGLRRWTPLGVQMLILLVPLIIGGLLLGNKQATYAGAFVLAALAVALMPHRISATAIRSVDIKNPVEQMDVPVQVFIDRIQSGLEVVDALSEDIDIKGGANCKRLATTEGRQQRWSYIASPHVSGPTRVGPLVARIHDPFRLRYQQKTLADQHVFRVQPKGQDLRKMPHQTKVPALIMGNHLVNKAGDGSEFHALREYRSGDSLRIVNWKASARSKDLMVNQRVHESLADLTILIDARAVSGAGPVVDTPLAQARRIALSLITGALRSRDKVRLFTYGDGVKSPQIGHGIQNLTWFLSDTGAQGNTSLADALDEIRGDLKSRSPLIIIGGLEADDTVLDAVATLRARQIDPVVVLCDVATQPDDGTAYPEPEQESILRHRQEIIAGMQAIGVQLYQPAKGMPLDTVFRMGAMA